MEAMSFDRSSIDAIFDKYRRSSTVFDECVPSHFGNMNSNDDDLRAEVAAMLYTTENAGDHYVVVSLGAAPGEWAVKSQQAYLSRRPDGKFKSYNLEGDLHHVALTKQFIADNSGSLKDHEVRYEVIASKDGFAYFPIINPGIDWGAGIAAVADNAEDLDQNITINDVARADRIGANGGKPLEFRTVKAVTLNTLLAQTGPVNLMHCDIQGAEIDVFPPQMDAMNANVSVCCVGTHGRTIESGLLHCFRENGWNLDYMFPCDERTEQGVERIYRDGVFVWSNPKLLVS